jgi:hypothetical protein
MFNEALDFALISYQRNPDPVVWWPLM